VFCGIGMLFGPASIGSPAKEGLKQLHEHGVKTSEIAFGRGVYMTNKLAKEVGELAKKLGISLSIHAPYYVNLNSPEKAKVKASVGRIMQTCERAHHLGAKWIIFHAAYYMKNDPEEVYQRVKEEMVSMQKKIKEKGWDVVLCPETTGKGSQFGSLDELVRLSEETGCGVCVDFAHLKARNIGEIDYDEVMKKVKKIKHLTCHFSGIVWGEKGERHHILTPEEEIKELLSYLKKYKINTRIINESPDVFGDTLKSIRIWNEME
jgi:deoxyribonuclease-4